MARAQDRERPRRIGAMMSVLATIRPVMPATRLSGRLLQSGWTVGRNVRIEYRWGTGEIARKHAADGNRGTTTPVMDGRGLSAAAGTVVQRGGNVAVAPHGLYFCRYGGQTITHLLPELTGCRIHDDGALLLVGGLDCRYLFLPADPTSRAP
jgi:hypothetical protein